MSRKSKSPQESIGGVFEHYETPRQTVELLRDNVHLPQGEWLEPCVGSGAIPQILKDKTWTVGDIRSDCPTPEGYICRYHQFNTDFSHWANERIHTNSRYDGVITNPPFSHAQRLIESFWPNRTDTLVLLLRLDFLGTKKRAAWWQGREPNGLYVITPRPRFNGRSDSCEYAWFVWSRFASGQTIRILR